MIDRTAERPNGPRYLLWRRWFQVRTGTSPHARKGFVLSALAIFVPSVVNLGRPETKVLADDWTAVTRDKSLSAQYEHLVGVTATGCEIFTTSPAGRFFRTWE
jgi:methionine aminopeptidase